MGFVTVWASAKIEMKPYFKDALCPMKDGCGLMRSSLLPVNSHNDLPRF
jgi:hypothetical protein